MVSSRRLAREWALKILYQVDVGKTSVEEAQAAALERLRREFVQRGSRTASGSATEEVCLEWVSSELRDTLPELRLPLERALTAIIGRAFGEAAYWQELRVERAWRTHARGLPLSPPRLLTPTPSLLESSVQPDALTPEERSRANVFAAQLREELPRLLDAEFKRSARLFAKEVAANRPAGAGSEPLRDYVHARREEFNTSTADRWRRVGAVVQKQVGDWLRTAAFTVKLVDGACEKQAEIDRELTALSSGWTLERQVSVDRNIMRLAAFELLFLPGVPTSATINEAVELAKKYSTAESGRFVNGVLGALSTQIGEKTAPFGVTSEILEADEHDAVVDLPDTELLEETGE